MTEAAQTALGSISFLALEAIGGTLGLTAVLALAHGVPADAAAEPTQMYRVAFGYVTGGNGQAALLLMGAFVLVSQLKINLTNAYAGSIAWSNFFSRLRRPHRAAGRRHACA